MLLQPRSLLFKSIASPLLSSSSTSSSSSTAAKGLATQVSPSPLISLTIDGRQVSVPQGTALIQACELAGVSIPRFCYHERLAIAGNCRMCLVEVQKSPKPVASCAMPAMAGSVVFTDSDLVRKAREGVMELLLTNHPLDCPVCDQGGECDLQDQSVRYGSDRSRFHEVAGKRAVENKDFGPIIKTEMNRCIQCTRCVRFANDVAGVEEFGTTGRGNDMQIGTYIEKVFKSELSGNIIDLCPVGALLSKPYAFTARPWELKHTESVDVLDAVGSNIRIDSRGLQVMRVQPRTNEDVNEEWISDKTRYAYDGLRYQRLTHPLVKEDGKFIPATWPEALTAITQGLEASSAKGDEIQAVAGALADAESLVALRDLMHKLGSENLAYDSPSGSANPVQGADIRSNYLFNSSIPNIEEADMILLIGTNPRHEAAVLNSRIRKSWLKKSNVQVGLIGEEAELTYDTVNLGAGISALNDFAAGKSEFAKSFQVAKKPLIIVGSSILDDAECPAVYQALQKISTHQKNLITDEWNGISILHRHASRAAALDINFSPSKSASKVTPRFVYLLGADEFAPSKVPENAFVVYQGHHGDAGASIADVILPGCAYTEKSGTWVNTEGRSQVGRIAVSAPGAAREDWKILRAWSEILNLTLPYSDTFEIRQRMHELCPSLVRYDTFETTSQAVARLGLAKFASSSKTAPKKSPSTFKNPIQDFYLTDPISRASVTLSKCSKAFTHGIPQHDELSLMEHRSSCVGHSHSGSPQMLATA